MSKYSNNLDVLDRQVISMQKKADSMMTFEINSTNSTLDVNIILDDKTCRSFSVPFDFTREKVQKGIVIVTCLAGGALIGGPVGLLVAGKLLALGTAGVGAGLGTGLGFHLWEKTSQERNLGEVTWYDRIPLIKNLEDSIISITSSKRRRDRRCSLLQEETNLEGSEFEGFELDILSDDEEEQPIEL